MGTAHRMGVWGKYAKICLVDCDRRLERSFRLWERHGPEHRGPMAECGERNGWLELRLDRDFCSQWRVSIRKRNPRRAWNAKRNGRNTLPGQLSIRRPDVGDASELRSLLAARWMRARSGSTVRRPRPIPRSLYVQHWRRRLSPTIMSGAECLFSQPRTQRGQPGSKMNEGDLSRPRSDVRFGSFATCAFRTSANQCPVYLR